MLEIWGKYSRLLNWIDTDHWGPVIYQAMKYVLYTYFNRKFLEWKALFALFYRGDNFR